MPFHCTVDVGTKLEPFTTICIPKTPLATEILDGDKDETDGAGLFAPEIVKSTMGEAIIAFAEFTTETPAKPDVEISEESIAAVSCVAFTNVVVRN